MGLRRGDEQLVNEGTAPMRAPIGPEATPEQRKRAMLALFLTIFISLIGFGIIIPLLPAYGQNMGATPWEIGWLFASYSLAQLISGPMWGDLSDRYGRRPILMISLFGTVVSFIMLAKAQTLTMLFVSRILDGLSGGNISAARAYIADITTPENRARSFGVIGVAFGLGFILGPALGGLTYQISLAAPAWVAALLTLVAMGVTYVWLPETRHDPHAHRPPFWTSLFSVLAHPAMAYLMIVDFLIWSALSVYQTTFPLFADRRFHWSPTHIGLVLAGVGFIGALTQGMFVGRLVKQLGEKRVMLLGLTLGALSLVAASLSMNPVVFLLFLAPAVVASGLISPSLIAMISQASRADEQGRVQGVASAIEGLGRAVGPVWGNGLLQARGEGASYLSAGLVLLWTAFMALGIKQPKHAVEAEEEGAGFSPPS